MRVLIRHTRTGHFYSESGSWTENKEEATVFPDSNVASEKCSQIGQPDCEIVLAFESARYDVSMPCS